MVRGLYHNVENLVAFAQSDTKRVGTGMLPIDKLIRGPAPGEVCMIIGRSYTGKSIIGQNIIYYNSDMPSIFFSMEMPAMQAVIRLYSMYADVSSTDVQNAVENGEAPDDLWDLVEAFPHHEIVDKPGVTIGEMSEAIYDFEERHGMRPEFVVVDYLELLGGAKQSGEGYIATEQQSTMLKDWAKQEEMRVFALHQTNKQEQPWHPPTENSARGGGFTEADFVLGLWRPHLDPDIDHIKRITLKNKIAVNVLKNRPYFLETSRVDINITHSLRVWREEAYADDRDTNITHSRRVWREEVYADDRDTVQPGSEEPRPDPY